jgi:hypothetical protein
MKIHVKAALLKGKGFTRNEALEKIKALVKKEGRRWTQRAMDDFNMGWKFKTSMSIPDARTKAKGKKPTASIPEVRKKVAKKAAMPVARKSAARSPIKNVTRKVQIKSLPAGKTALKIAPKATKVVDVREKAPRVKVVVDKGEGYNASTKGLIKALVLMVAWKRSLPISELKTEVKTSQPAITKFASSLGMTLTDFTSVLNQIISGKKYTDKNDEQLAGVAGAVREIAPVLKLAEYEILDQYLKLLNSTVSYLAKGDEKAFGRIIIGTPLLQSNAVSRAFIQFNVKPRAALEPLTIEEQASVYKQLTTLGAKIGANQYFGIPDEARQQAKLEQRDVVKKFNELLNKYHSSYLYYVKKFVVESGKSLLSTDEIRKKFKAAGLKDRLPDGFVGQVDETGTLYTSDGRMLGANHTGKAVMNPKYDPITAPSVYYVDFKKPNGKSGRTYTKEHMSGKREDKKQGAITPFIADTEKYRSKWLAILREKGYELPRIEAAMAEIIWQLALRIGSGEDASSKKVKTQGFTTIKCENVTMLANGFRLKYLGKDGVPVDATFSTKPNEYQKFTASDAKLVIEVMQYLMKGKADTDYVFTYKGKRIDSDMINKFLKGNGLPKGFTSHKFRHVRATMIAQAELGKADFPGLDPTNAKQAKEVVEFFKAAMLKVGAALGHVSGAKTTGTTAIKNYVSPAVMSDYFNRLGVRFPAPLAKVLIGRTNRAEAGDGLRVEIRAEGLTERASGSSRVERSIYVKILS